MGLLSQSRRKSRPQASRGKPARTATWSGPLWATRGLQLLCLLSLVAWAMAFVPGPTTPPARLVDGGAGSAVLDKERLTLSVQALLGLSMEPKLRAQAQEATAGSANPSAEGVQLLGIVSNPSNGGAALLATGSGPAKPYRPGMDVTPDWRLHHITDRSVVLRGPNGDLTLRLPDKWSPNAGQPGAGMGGAMVTPPPATIASPAVPNAAPASMIPEPPPPVPQPTNPGDPNASNPAAP